MLFAFLLLYDSGNVQRVPHPPQDKVQTPLFSLQTAPLTFISYHSLTPMPTLPLFSEARMDLLRMQY